MDYRELEVWQKAHALTLALYEATRNWPKDELYALTSQVRRAAVSIGANLAEGQGRFGNAEFARFARLSAGSAAELEYELLLARDLGYLSSMQHEQFAGEISRIRRMLGALASRLGDAPRPASCAPRREQSDV